MFIPRIALLSCAILGATVGAAGAAIPAGELAEPSGTLTLSQSEGPEGTVVTLSGDNCPSGEGLSAEVTYGTGYGSPTPDSASIPTNADGSWSTTFTAHPEAVPGDVIDADASCTRSDGTDEAEAGEFDYDEIWFYFTPQTGLGMTPTTGAPGSTFVVTGHDCIGAELGNIALPAGAPAATTPVVDEGGNWSTTFTVPADAVPGSVIPIDATCERDGVRATIRRAPSGTFFANFAYDTRNFTVSGGTVVTTPVAPPANIPTSAVAGAVAATPKITG